MARMQNSADQQLTEDRDAFALFDKKGDGKIDVEQIGDVLRALGLNPPQTTINKLQNDVGGRDTGKRLTFEEFMPYYRQLASRENSGSAADFLEGLRVFDKDGSGTLSVTELRHVLTSIGEKLTNPEVDKLLKEVGTENGMVNYEEFVQLIMTG